ncbi:predicted protein [Uncinocarpus reesii 1704]|uniref:MMS19 nucleotide excision repair protein n=1 Tax=Uncinocarpus reesii (strain UAMH 1704) TaxID=336963 RepID=C4JIW2_UNCRE|nr:uncharacterized protein UREG_01569 [Uncinocarpus reesii 1704]EEP76720.1 predicted protein [Uncinocarpus reesii 1704]
MVEWDISNHVQTLFDSVYKYFPITFRSHPDSLYKITAQDLKDRLQDCLASTQAFAPLAFPDLLNKLDSNSVNTKKDALNALGACVLSYEPFVLARYSVTIWDSLKFEILNAQDDVLADESLRVLQLLLKRLSPPTPGTEKQPYLAHYMKPVLQECHDQLREPQQMRARPAQRILAFFSSSSSVAFDMISRAVIPPLFAEYRKTDDISKQRALLDTFICLFDSAISNFGTWLTPGPAPIPDNPLLEFKDQLIEIFSQALTNSPKDEVGLRTVALQGALKLSTLQGFLQNDEIGFYVQYFDDVLLNERFQEPQLRRQAVNALAEISKHKPALVISITIPAFMAHLPDNIPDMESKSIIVLEDLALLSTEQAVFYTFVSQLLKKLDVILTPGNLSSPAYVRAMLMSVLYAMERRGLDNDPHLEVYYQEIVCNLCRRAALAAVCNTEAAALSDPTVLDMLGRLCNQIIRFLPQHRHQEVCNNVYSLYSTQEEFPPIPLQGKSTLSRRRTMILSTYLLAGLSKDSIYPESDMAGLLAEVSQLSALEEDPPIQSALVRQLALLVNKFLTSSDLGIASKLLSSFMPSSPDDRKFSPQRVFSIVAPLISEKVRTLNTEPLDNENVTSQRNERKSAYLTALSGILFTMPSTLILPELPTLLPLLLQSLDLTTSQSEQIKTSTLETLAVIIRESGIHAIDEAGYVEDLL